MSLDGFRTVGRKRKRKEYTETPESLAGFERVSVYAGAPAVTFAGNRITFNRAAVDKMGRPSTVAFFLNRQNKEFAMAECPPDDPYAVPFAKNGRFAKYGSRTNNIRFAEDLAELMGWDLKNKSYRVLGKWSPGNAMLFTLTEAIESIETRGRKKRAVKPKPPS